MTRTRATIRPPPDTNTSKVLRLISNFSPCLTDGPSRVAPPQGAPHRLRGPGPKGPCKWDQLALHRARRADAMAPDDSPRVRCGHGGVAPGPGGDRSTARLLIGRPLRTTETAEGAHQPARGPARALARRADVGRLRARGDRGGPGGGGGRRPPSRAPDHAGPSWRCSRSSSSPTARSSTPTRPEAAPTRCRGPTSGPGPACSPEPSLIVDYTLTVAVSIAAGVGALTSAFPSLCLGDGAVVPGHPRPHHRAQPARAG